MADWKRLAATGAVVAIAVAGLLIWDDATLARDPPRLFRTRCGSCHDLPDLSPYGKADMKRIVQTMRDKNGADEVITDTEARVIVGYLEEVPNR